jgi:hypothetical protein
MLRKLIISGFGVVLHAGDGSALAVQRDCAGYAWPNYPADCLAREDGQATKPAVRTAIANPPMGAPDIAPLPAINFRPSTNSRGGGIDRIEERHEQFDRLEEPAPSAQTTAITVWRGTERTIYIVGRI